MGDPPELPDVTFRALEDGLTLSLEDGKKLYLYLAAMRQWVETVQTLCGD